MLSHSRHGAPNPVPPHTTISQHAMRQVYVVKTRVHNYFTMYMLYSKARRIVSMYSSPLRTQKNSEKLLASRCRNHDNCHESWQLSWAWQIIVVLTAINTARNLVWNPQIIVVLPQDAENGLKSTNNHCSSRHKHSRNMVWNPQIIIVLPAINIVRKLVWNLQIIILTPDLQLISLPHFHFFSQDPSQICSLSRHHPV